MNISSQHPEDDELYYRSQIDALNREKNRYRDRIRTQIDEQNRNLNTSFHQNPTPTPRNRKELILFMDQIRKNRTPRNRKELILFMDPIRKNRKPQQDHEYDEAAYVDLDKINDHDDDDDRFVYIEEALKGSKMNPTWKRKIFSQRVEDDDEELRKQIVNKLKHYHPDVAPNYWVQERYCILEMREYQKDVSATEGFEVGYYPYLGRTGNKLINRYYCPPDANPSHDSMISLYGLALHAIQFYNMKEQTNYKVVKVIKTMTSVAAGTWFYMTFQASRPCYDDQLWTFEAKLFRSIPSSQEQNIIVDFVRLKKMGTVPSSLIQEPQACCSSSNSFFIPYAGQS